MKMVAKFIDNQVFVYQPKKRIAHTHTLEVCDSLRTVSAVNKIIKTETNGRTDWQSSSIAQNIGDATKHHFGVDLFGSQYLNAAVNPKKVSNARRKMNKIHDSSDELCIREFFHKNDYLFKDFFYDEIKSVAFMHKTVCKWLVSASGKLCLFDSTHGMLRGVDWRLSTIYCKHQSGKWFPGGQFWLPKENSEGVKAGI